MYSYKRPLHCLENSDGSSDYRLQISSPKRHCRDKTYSPTKYAIQMERREVTHDLNTEMDCEPSPSLQNIAGVQQLPSNHISLPSPLMESNNNNNNMGSEPSGHVNNCSSMFNNNNNNIADQYTAPPEVCVRCQAGEAGHYGHIGR